MGNVTILDSLTTRLEYIPDSAQASVKANGWELDDKGELVRDPESGRPRRAQNPVTFSTQVNQGDSLILRWEIRDPLEPGQGGVIRFQCRVR
jgi:hypothetical protein